jgi:glutamate synthase (NADPH/NADH) large chain
MKSHETRLSHALLDPFMDDLKPVVQAGGSDTATLDNVFGRRFGDRHAGTGAPAL